MVILLFVLVALIGLAVGSFLNVVIWRVPRGESVVNPPSACPRCGNPVRPRDNIPVLSWLVLPGRCRDCGEPISARYPLVESATALLFVGVLAVFLPRADGLAAVPAYLYFAAIAVALALIDLDTHRLPNAIVLPSYVVGAALLTLASVVSGDGAALLRAAIGAAAMFALYFLLALVPRGMGMGDVKLAGVLGLYLGYLGWGTLVVGLFGAFVLGGLFGIALLLFTKAGRRSAIPFGPWMLAGAAVGVAFGEPIAAAYLAIVGL